MVTLPPRFWLHLPPSIGSDLIEPLTLAIRARVPNAAFVFTAPEASPGQLSRLGDCVQAPLDRSRQTDVFLHRWRPRSVGWLDGRLRHGTLGELMRQNVPVHLVDTGNAQMAAQRLWFLPSFGRARLRQFASITVGGEDTRLALLRSGAASGQISVVGLLERSAVALDFSAAERDDLARQIGTRPIWLAACVEADEIETVLAAHMQAMRRSHRLLLILVPADPALAPRAEAAIRDRNMSVLTRSAGHEPDAECQVYLGDSAAELGLWYRLAPIAFLGGTLAGERGGPDPYDAAALGSAVVHGPHTGTHAVQFARLMQAGASRQVGHAGELAFAIDALLAPDRSAAMAHAAWQICTASALVAEHVAAQMTGIESAPEEQSE